MLLIRDSINKELVILEPKATAGRCLGTEEIAALAAKEHTNKCERMIIRGARS